MRNAMGNAMSNAPTAERQTDVTYIAFAEQPQSVVLTPQGTPADIEPGELPRCLRHEEQPVARHGGPLTTIKKTFGLSELTPVVTQQLPTMTPLLPPPLPGDDPNHPNNIGWRRHTRVIGSATKRNRNLISMVAVAGLSGAGFVTLFTNVPSNHQQETQYNGNGQRAQITRTAASAAAPTSKDDGGSVSSVAHSPSTSHNKSVEDLQLATSTAGDALDIPSESTGILAAVTHNFGLSTSSRTFEPVAGSPVLIPTGPSRLIETLTNSRSRPAVRLDAVIAAPRKITVMRGTRRIMPVLLASPEYATQIRTVLITGLPKAAELSAASRNGLGGWVLVPEALGVAELTLPDEVEGTSEIVIKAFGTSPNPVGITVMQLTIAGAAIEPEKARDAHKSIAEALVLFERGDVDGARGLLSAVVDVGNPHAAYVFAETFDPAGLSERVLDNSKADVERARFWYQRALKGGYSRASERLASLPLITREVMVQDKSGK